MSPHVIRVPLQKSAADDEDYVLIRVNSTGTQNLDLQLMSTDNSRVWQTTLRDDRIAQTEGAKASGPALWGAILRWVLLLQPPEQAHMHIVDKLDLNAAAEGEGKLVVKIRQNISGIIVSPSSNCMMHY